MNPALLSMALLLMVSACFSGSEAALFTLVSRHPGVTPGLSRKLLQKPAVSLTVILLGNLLVNLAYFASSAAWASSIGGRLGFLISASAVLGIVLFGEILPKVIAHRRPVGAAWLLLPPVWLLFWFLRPLAVILNRFLFREPTPQGMSPETVGEMLEAEGDELLPAAEADLLKHVLEMGVLRAGAVRRPLRKTLEVPADIPLAKARQMMREHRRAWVAVANQDGKLVGVLDLTRNPEGERVSDAMAPLAILPEVAPLARGATLLRETGLPFVLLVDEYGEPAGLLERGRWADTLLDRASEDTEGIPSIRTIAENRYLIEASLPLHLFRERFGDPGEVDPKLDTIGGLLAERLESVPILGDKLELQTDTARLELKVTQCDGSLPTKLQLTVYSKTSEGGDI
ncbi:MAG: CNNM domain-containing protein [Planctomycetota bacterium]|jgi:CBS domain containing-hemolysin-like protein|nr:CNNM domain-containing protein [Planctomycetota bacterium]MDP6942163.1 CNNM domain-containing protein [Planctomycetota bacterium]